MSVNPDGVRGGKPDTVVAGAGNTVAPAHDVRPDGTLPRDRSLTQDIFGTYSTRLLIIGLSVITGVITARMLGPHNRGVFALVYQFAATVVTFAKMGLAQSSVYSIRRERVGAERVAANALCVALVLGLASALLAFGLRHRLLATMLRGVPQWALLISLPVIPILLFESYFYAILQALGKFGLYNRRMLIGTVSLVLGLFTFLVVIRGGLEAAILVVVCNPILMDAWLLVTMHRMFPLSVRPEMPLLWRQVRFGVKSHAQVLAQHMHLRADVYLVAYFLNPAQVAFYILAVRLAEFMLDIPRTVSMALYPRLASLDDRAMHRLTAQACRRTILLTTVGGTLLSVAGPMLIVLWYGYAYAPAGRPLPLIAAGIVMLSVFVSLTQSFTSRNRQQINIIAGLIALVGNITLNVFLIPAMGILGAALSSAISYGVASALLLAFFVRASGLSVAEVLIPQGDDLRYFWNLLTGLMNRSMAVSARWAAARRRTLP
ncbi:MAG: lipopolysaccharide biosynthesis protein [Candidatus Binatia bacterium]